MLPSQQNVLNLLTERIRNEYAQSINQDLSAAERDFHALKTAAYHRRRYTVCSSLFYKCSEEQRKEVLARYHLDSMPSGSYSEEALLPWQEEFLNDIANLVPEDVLEAALIDAQKDPFDYSHTARTLVVKKAKGLSVLQDGDPELQEQVGMANELLNTDVYSHLLSSLDEQTGNSNANRLKRNALEFLATQPQAMQDFFYNDGLRTVPNLLKLSEVSPEDRYQIFPLTLSSQMKTAMREIFAELDRLEIIPKDVKMDEKMRTPSYAFEPLMNARSTYQKAVIDGTEAGMRNLAAYNEAYVREYDKVAHMLHFISEKLPGDPYVYPSNISPTRSDEFPIEFKKDMRALACFASTSLILATLRAHKIEVDNFLDDPIGTTRAAFHTAIKKHGFDSYLKDRFTFQTFAQMSKHTNDEVPGSALAAMFDRVLEGVTVMDPEVENNPTNTLAALMLGHEQNLLAQDLYLYKDYFDKYVLKGSVWQAALLMPYGTLDLRALTGQEDMLNGITNQLVTPKPFDTLEYVKSHDIDFAELNARVKDSLLEYTLHEGNFEFYPELVKKTAEVVQTALYVKQPQFEDPNVQELLNFLDDPTAYFHKANTVVALRLPNLPKENSPFALDKETYEQTCKQLREKNEKALNAPVKEFPTNYDQMSKRGIQEYQLAALQELDAQLAEYQAAAEGDGTLQERAPHAHAYRYLLTQRIKFASRIYNQLSSDKKSYLQKVMGFNDTPEEILDLGTPEKFNQFIQCIKPIATEAMVKDAFPVFAVKGYVDYSQRIYPHEERIAQLKATLPFDPNVATIQYESALDTANLILSTDTRTQDHHAYSVSITSANLQQRKLDVLAYLANGADEETKASFERADSYKGPDWRAAPVESGVAWNTLCEKYPFTISEAQRTAFATVINAMREWEVVPDVPQRSKSGDYTTTLFDRLENATIAIENAVVSGTKADLDALFKLNDEYQKQYDTMTKLYALGETYFHPYPYSYPENIDSQRNPRLPAAFTRDPSLNSYLNALSLVDNFLKMNDISLETFLDDPLRCMNEHLERLTAQYGFQTKTQGKSLGNILAMASNSSSAQSTRMLVEMMTLGRIMDVFVCMEPDPQKRMSLELSNGLFACHMKAVAADVGLLDEFYRLFESKAASALFLIPEDKIDFHALLHPFNRNINDPRTMETVPLRFDAVNYIQEKGVNLALLNQQIKSTLLQYAMAGGKQTTFEDLLNGAREAVEAALIYKGANLKDRDVQELTTFVTNPVAYLNKAMPQYKAAYEHFAFGKVDPSTKTRIPPANKLAEFKKFEDRCKKERAAFMKEELAFNKAIEKLQKEALKLGKEYEKTARPIEQQDAYREKLAAKDAEISRLKEERKSTLKALVRGGIIPEGYYEQRVKDIDNDTQNRVLPLFAQGAFAERKFDAQRFYGIPVQEIETPAPVAPAIEEVAATEAPVVETPIVEESTPTRIRVRLSDELSQRENEKVAEDTPPAVEEPEEKTSEPVQEDKKPRTIELDNPIEL